MIERANYTITKITITTIIVIKVELLYFHMMITDPWTGSVSWSLPLPPSSHNTIHTNYTKKKNFDCFVSSRFFFNNVAF